MQLFTLGRDLYVFDLLESLFSHRRWVELKCRDELPAGWCAVKQTNERGRERGKRKKRRIPFHTATWRAQRIKWRVNYGEMHGEISPRRRRPVCVSRGQRGGTRLKEEEIRGTEGSVSMRGRKGVGKGVGSFVSSLIACASRVTRSCVLSQPFDHPHSPTIALCLLVRSRLKNRSENVNSSVIHLVKLLPHLEVKSRRWF